MAWSSTQRSVVRTTLVMKLIVAIVHAGDAAPVIAALVRAGHPGATRIDTIGGFLRRGNATLVLGTDDQRVEDVVGVIRSTVEGRPAPDNLNAHRVTFFVLDVRRHLRL